MTKKREKPTERIGGAILYISPRYPPLWLRRLWWIAGVVILLIVGFALGVGAERWFG